MVFEFMFLQGAGHLVDLSAFLEEYHVRGAHDLIPRCGRRIAVNIQLRNLESPHVLLGQLLENRGQQVAVATGIGIELREHGPGKGEHFAAECPVCRFDHVIIKRNRLEGRVAFTAFALILDQGLEDAIFCSAFRALDDNGLRMQGLTALSAQRFIFQLFLRHPVVGAALGAPDDSLSYIHFPSNAIRFYDTVHCSPITTYPFLNHLEERLGLKIS
jgi:hypothetical protein